MNNGCICCTVRGDLVRILGKILSRTNRKLDAIIIETTGLADPAPVAQTFFMDESIKARARLDAIITVVDARHCLPKLREERAHFILLKCHSLFLLSILITSYKSPSTICQ